MNKSAKEERTGTAFAAADKRVILSMGGKGGVGKTSVMTGLAEWFVENKFGVIGTPDDAIALIERLRAKQGKFGVFLHQAHNWADWEATKRSYELYARYVMPHFADDNVPRVESFDWCTDHRDELTEKRSAAARAMFDKHEAEQRAAREAATPLRRLGAPDDIAGLAVLLAGKAGAFITGQTLIADGGTCSGG